MGVNIIENPAVNVAVLVAALFSLCIITFPLFISNYACYIHHFELYVQLISLLTAIWKGTNGWTFFNAYIAIYFFYSQKKVACNILQAVPTRYWWISTLLWVSVRVTKPTILSTVGVTCIPYRYRCAVCGFGTLMVVSASAACCCCLYVCVCGNVLQIRNGFKPFQVLIITISSLSYLLVLVLPLDWEWMSNIRNHIIRVAQSILWQKLCCENPYMEEELLGVNNGKCFWWRKAP